MDKASFIREQLSKVPSADFSKPTEVKILCPFHNDENPSLDVTLARIVKPPKDGKIRQFPIGSFNCWSCKTSGGWNKLARKLGLELWGTEEEIADRPDDPFLALSHELEATRQAYEIRDAEYVKPPTDGLWEGSWRGLTQEFLRSVGAEMYWDKIAEEYRLYFPFQDFRGKVVGHILARGEDSSIPDKFKYMNSKAMPEDQHWYCLNFEKAPRKVVIVEGPYDTLRFRSCGIPAIGLLGLSKLTEAKIMVLISRGVEEVILALDGDEAGRAATPEYYLKFTEFGLNVVDLNLSRYTTPDQKIDPGNSPDVVIEDLKKYLGE